MTVTASVFDLPDRLAAKVVPDMIAADEAHFAAITRTVEETLADPPSPLGAIGPGAG